MKHSPTLPLSHCRLTRPDAWRHQILVQLACLATLALASQAQSAPAPDNNYRLRHGDLLEFAVFQEPDLRTLARIQADGSITLPLIQTIRAESLTLTELRAQLTELYDRDFLVDPQISLQIASYSSRAIQVIGQVNRPGTVPLPAEMPMRLLEAIGAAGGFTRRADAGKVTIRRIDDDGAQEIIEKDVGELLSKPDTNDIQLRDGDTILVGERWI